MSDTVNVVPILPDRGRRADEIRGDHAAVDSALFKQGMRRLASGVSIVATAFGGERYGLVATAVSSVSADPPTLLVCVSRSATTGAFIARSGRFSVNVLGADDRGLADRFSTPGLGVRRFDFGGWTTLHTGAPVLLSALASFDCLVTEEAHVASHTVFFGRVARVRLRDGAINPLLFWNGAYHDVPAADL